MALCGLVPRLLCFRQQGTRPVPEDESRCTRASKDQGNTTSQQSPDKATDDASTSLKQQVWRSLSRNLKQAVDSEHGSHQPGAVPTHLSSSNNGDNSRNRNSTTPSSHNQLQHAAATGAMQAAQQASSMPASGATTPGAATTAAPSLVDHPQQWHLATGPPVHVNSSSLAPPTNSMPDSSQHMQAIMQQAPCLLTTISADGMRVLYQNAASQKYYGDLVTATAQQAAGQQHDSRGARRSTGQRTSWEGAVRALAANALQATAAPRAPLPASTELLALEHLFPEQQPGTLEDLLASVQAGQTWRKVLQVQKAHCDGDTDVASVPVSAECNSMGNSLQYAGVAPMWGVASSLAARNLKPHAEQTQDWDSCRVVAGPPAAAASGGSAAELVPPPQRALRHCSPQAGSCSDASQGVEQGTGTACAAAAAGGAAVPPALYAEQSPCHGTPGACLRAVPPWQSNALYSTPLATPPSPEEVGPANAPDACTPVAAAAAAAPPCRLQSSSMPLDSGGNVEALPLTPTVSPEPLHGESLQQHRRMNLSSSLTNLSGTGETLLGGEGSFVIHQQGGKLERGRGDDEDGGDEEGDERGLCDAIVLGRHSTSTPLRELGAGVGAGEGDAGAVDLDGAVEPRGALATMRVVQNACYSAGGATDGVASRGSSMGDASGGGSGGGSGACAYTMRSNTVSGAGVRGSHSSGALEGELLRPHLSRLRMAAGETSWSCQLLPLTDGASSGKAADKAQHQRSSEDVPRWRSDLVDVLVSPPARTLSIMQFASRSNTRVRSPSGSSRGTSSKLQPSAASGSHVGPKSSGLAPMRAPARSASLAVGAGLQLPKAWSLMQGLAGEARSDSEPLYFVGPLGVPPGASPSPLGSSLRGAPLAAGAGGPPGAPAQEECGAEARSLLPPLQLQGGLGGSAELGDTAQQVLAPCVRSAGVPEDEEEFAAFGATPMPTLPGPAAKPFAGPPAEHAADAAPVGQQGAVLHPGCEDVWHDVTAQPLPDPSGAPAILITQFDVTNRVQAETYLAWLSERQLSMLSGMLPRHVIEFLSVSNEMHVPKQISSLARAHDDVTILFLDVVGFTSMSKQVEPRVVMAFLNLLFTTLDALCDEHGVQKVETAGDAYIAACGILSSDADGFKVAGGEHNATRSAQRMLQFAKAVVQASHLIRMPHTGQPLMVRVGLHTGSCVSGLVGVKIPKFSLFGDTMNTASRMESTCIPGHIQVSEATWHVLSLPDAAASEWRATGGVQVKGKGVMQTFLWAEAVAGAEAPETEAVGGGVGQHAALEESSRAPRRSQERPGWQIGKPDSANSAAVTGMGSSDDSASPRPAGALRPVLPSGGSFRRRSVDKGPAPRARCSLPAAALALPRAAGALGSCSPLSPRSRSSLAAGSLRAVTTTASTESGGTTGPRSMPVRVASSVPFIEPPPHGRQRMSTLGAPALPSTPEGIPQVPDAPLHPAPSLQLPCAFPQYRLSALGWRPSNNPFASIGSTSTADTPSTLCSRPRGLWGGRDSVLSYHDWTSGSLAPSGMMSAYRLHLRASRQQLRACMEGGDKADAPKTRRMSALHMPRESTSFKRVISAGDIQDLVSGQNVAPALFT